MASHWELAWRDRPNEEAALFNPAFCGELMARAVADHVRIRREGLPIALSFLILPIALSAPLRDALPRRSSTTFLTWAGMNRVALSILPQRVQDLRPVTREALLFMAQHRALRIDRASIRGGDEPLRLHRRPEAVSNETAAIRSAASFLGRWFARQGSTAQIMQTMGLRP